ncbi:hypothetical protein FG386_000780 [Cryptosporidium ryanae]|uniref:uncharacterized protein n=1 Tax=Cryptosporidium ryanae TaxID=515981 RepID=UPI00351A028B|nr:hypothetical protein FG386_000780 [Cryptosporidium ryanae]
MSGITKGYHLSNELYGHEKCIRCVCILEDDRIVTGGLDNKIYIWNNIGYNNWRWERCLSHHTRYVLALEASKSSLDKYQKNTFYSGGLDQIIYRVSADNGKILLTFEGHKSAICSIKEICELNLLVSGSWDGNARIWDLDSSVCKHILSGHSHAVTIGLVPYIENGNTYLLSGSQNKTLFLWRIPYGEAVDSIINSHNDIIRSIAIKKCNYNQKYIVATVSNDCVIKIWELIIKFGQEKITYRTSKNYHTSFIFDALFSKNHDTRLFTASDDFKVGIWNISENFELSLVQAISLQSTVWSLAESISTDSLITASDDGVCRIWSTGFYNENSEITVNKVELQGIQESNNKNNVYNEDVFNLDEEILDIEKLDEVIGTEIGEIKLFKNNSITYAYKWEENSWVLLGKIKNKIGNKSGVLFSGDEYFSYGVYDFIFHIKINDRNILTLPFNLDDNIQTSVEKFCLREGISPADYSNTIYNLIKNKISNLEDEIDSNIFLTIKTDIFEPFLEYKLFRNYNIDGLIKNLVPELSKLIQSRNGEINKRNVCIIFDTDINHLNDFFNRMKVYRPNDYRLNELQIKSVEMDIIYKKMSNLLGIKKMTVSIIDLWRILALHPQSSDIHKKSDQGWWLISSILKLIGSLYSENDNEYEHKEINELSARIFLISLRFLCNMFYNPTNRQVMLSRKRDILHPIDNLIKKILKNKSFFTMKKNLYDNVELSISTLFLNYTIALNLFSTNSIETMNLLIINSVELIREFKNTEYSDNKNEVLYNLLLVLSNNYYYYLNNSTLEKEIFIIEDSLLNIISQFIENNNKCDPINITEKVFRNLLNLINRVKI